MYINMHCFHHMTIISSQDNNNSISWHMPQNNWILSEEFLLVIERKRIKQINKTLLTREWIAQNNTVSFYFGEDWMKDCWYRKKWLRIAPGNYSLVIFWNGLDFHMLPIHKILSPDFFVVRAVSYDGCSSVLLEMYWKGVHINVLYNLYNNDPGDFSISSSYHGW